MNSAVTLPEIPKDDWARAKCDKYDYLISVFCGAVAGLVDILFVGAPGQSRLSNLTDAATDGLVKKFARMNGWSPSAGQTDNVGSAIGFLERNYRVNYEHTSTVSVGGKFPMTTQNHHYKSLGHSPDIVGLFFSILDQFTNKASYMSGGQLIRVDSSDPDFRLQGSNPISMLFCGFCNWLGHIMSDIAGSSGSRGRGSTGRGSGLPIPFSEMFLLCDFGKFRVGQDRQALGVVMTRAFQEGYDARFGAAMAIPVILQDLMIRVLWALKTHYYAGKDWRECVPTEAHADLRIMLLVGSGTLCLIDGAHAAIVSGGNALAFVLHMNLIAWSRLALLVFRELWIRFGPIVDGAVAEFLSTMGLADQYALKQYYQRLGTLKKQLNRDLQEFTVSVEKEYRVFLADLNYVMNPESAPPQKRLEKSVQIARRSNVSNDRIFEKTDELDDWVKGGQR